VPAFWLEPEKGPATKEEKMSEAQTSQDERLMAALAHASVILFGMGAIGAIVIWATQKDRSRYVAFQALQAAIYQLAGVLVTAIGWCCWMALYFASFIPLMSVAEQEGSQAPAVFWIATFLMFVPLALMALWALGGLWGAVRALQGRDFRYLSIGTPLERWLAR
jgi:uncharacterized Tic20 family protein